MAGTIVGSKAAPHDVSRLRLILLMASHFVNDGYMVILTPAIVPITLEFGLSSLQSGLLISMYTLTWGLAQTPFSLFADATGRGKQFLPAALCLASVTAAAYGLAGSYPVLLILIAAVGFLTSAYHPASMSILTDEFAPRQKGFWLGIHTLFGSLGSMLVPGIVGTVGFYVSWRAGVSLVGLIGLSISLLMLWVFIQEGEFQRRYPRPIEDVVKSVLLQPQLLVPAGIGAVSASAYYAGITFLPFLLYTRFGWNEFMVGLALMLFHGSSLLSQPVLGHLSDRFGRPLLLGVSLGLTGLASLLIPFSSNAWVMVGLGTFYGAMVLGLRPINLAAGTDLTAGRSSQATIGYLFTANMALGAVSPIIGGYLSEVWDPAAPFWVFGAFSLAAAAVLPALLHRFIRIRAAVAAAGMSQA